MKPSELLKKYLQADLAPSMASLGFKYSASQLHFSRKRNAIRQTFRFSLSKWNSQDNCSFWTLWAVTSKSYLEWHMQEWGELPENDSLGGAADWNLPAWERGQDRYFHFNNTGSDRYEIERLTKNINQVGIPFLDGISTWEGAAEQLLKDKSMYHRAADFLIIAGDFERAKEILLEGLRNYENVGRVDNIGELPKIKARVARYF